MWKRASIQLRTLAPWRRLHRSAAVSASTRSLTSASPPPPHSSPFQQTWRYKTPTTLFSHRSSSDSDIILKGKKRVADVMPIATGHEREELEAELEGRNVLEMNYPVGPFGTKEAPAIVQSVYNKRIVGCPGGEGEDEHDVVWFWLEKGKPHECPVCYQYFMLEVVGPGGSPDSHDHH